MTAVLLARVDAHGGTEAVRGLLRQAESNRSSDYLLDTGNWVSYEEAVALWRAGARVTHHPQFARAVGEDAARRLNGSPVAALLRSLGSPESVYRQMAVSATKFSTVSKLETVDAGPGFAEIVAVPVDGFPRAADHCAWTCGLLSQPTVLFGLPPATVEHESCAAYGAPECTYRVSWEQRVTEDSSEELVALRRQLGYARAPAPHVRDRWRPDRGGRDQRSAGPDHRSCRDRGSRPALPTGRAHQPGSGGPLPAQRLRRA